MELIKIPEAELEVMQAIWEKEKEGAVSSKVLTDYFLEKNNWKRTTTLTILGRLEKKNFLKRWQRLSRRAHSLQSRKRRRQNLSSLLVPDTRRSL